MKTSLVREAYRARAAEYIAQLGDIGDAAELDRQSILAWAQRIEGPIVDVGCGPGQWTNYLNENGLEVVGVDPVPEFVDHARNRYPGVAYRIGEAGQLAVADGALGGVLAWYSLIHTDPTDLGPILAEFARSLRPGGGLLIGFVTGPELAKFDHAVATAYSWPIEALAARVRAAGFQIIDTQSRTDAGARPHGAIVALLTPAATA